MGVTAEGADSNVAALKRDCKSSSPEVAFCLVLENDLLMYCWMPKLEQDQKDETLMKSFK